MSGTHRSLAEPDTNSVIERFNGCALDRDGSVAVARAMVRF
jgi:hypothetical protein